MKKSWASLTKRNTQGGVINSLFSLAIGNRICYTIGRNSPSAIVWLGEYFYGRRMKAMTLRGAVQQLKDIRDNKDFPFYLKTAISKAIETIEMERADAMDKQILVDLDALLELKVHYGETEYHFDHDAIPVDEIEDALKDGTLKVIDAEPIRHGRWIRKRLPHPDGGTYEVFECTECNGDFNWRSDYCPHCGAKMG